MTGRLALNEKIDAIAPSVTLGIEARAKEITARGKKICSFAAGEPDFDTPLHIKEAAARALAAGQTKYCPVAGVTALRSAIADKLKKDNGLAYDVNQIVLSNGAKHSLFNVFMALCRTDDEVVLPAPYWLSYAEMIRIAGGVPVVVACREENDFKMTAEEFERAITPHTKAVVINSPSNPVGNVYSGAELKALADVAVKHGVYMVADEIYEKMVYENTVHVSVGSFSKEALDHTITVNGFSKAYAMTGWRLGYFAAPSAVVKVVNAFQSHSTSGPNTFAQFGAVEALQGPQDCVTEMVKAFAERQAYIYKRMTGIPGITCVKPMGAFYILPNISHFGMGSVEFAEHLLEKEGVAVVPGLPFGSDKHVRLSYACGLDQIREGMDKFERFIQSL